jgi:hypothetical protein
MVVCGKGVGKELRCPTGRKKDYGFPEVDHEDATTVPKSPPEANLCRNRHLPTGGDEIVR